MKKAFTIAAVAALALGAAACQKSAEPTTNVSAEDNMLVPADENAMGDMNASMGATDNMAMDNGAMADTNAAATTNAQ
jgi:hypothetical protein